MAVYKRGEVWWFKFVWNGELVRASTKQGDKRVAEQIEESNLREKLPSRKARSIKELQPAPTWKENASRRQ